MRFLVSRYFLLFRIAMRAEVTLADRPSLSLGCDLQISDIKDLSSGELSSVAAQPGAAELSSAFNMYICASEGRCPVFVDENSVTLAVVIGSCQIAT
jgi:hypothetical protein